MSVCHDASNSDKQKTRYDNRKEATYHDMPIEKSLVTLKRLKSEIRFTPIRTLDRL